MRPINDISKNKDVVIVEHSYNLTDTEIDALRNAISNEFMNHQRWTTDNYGRVKVAYYNLKVNKRKLMS